MAGAGHRSRPEQGGLEGHEAEGLGYGGVHDERGFGIGLGELVAGQHAPGHDARAEAGEAPEASGRETAHQMHLRRGLGIEDADEGRDALLGRVRADEEQPRRRLRRRRRAAGRLHAVRDDAGRPRQLGRFGLAQRQQGGGARDDPPAPEPVEQRLGQAMLAMMGIRPVGLEDERDAVASQGARRDPGEAAAVAVQVGDVEPIDLPFEPAPESQGDRHQPAQEKRRAREAHDPNALPAFVPGVRPRL